MHEPARPTSSPQRSSDCHSCPVAASRRNFLALATGGFALALANATYVEGRTGTTADEKRYPIPAGDGVSIDRAAEVILVRFHNQVFAFNLACPHENYALRWKDKDVMFQCPEHQSRYQPDGTFVDGRATRNMDRFAIKREGNDIVINLDLLYRSDKQTSDWTAAVVRL